MKMITGTQNVFPLHYFFSSYSTLGSFPHTMTTEILAGDQLAIAKETGRRLGMGTNMYPSSALLGGGEAESTILMDELIEKADGFAGVFPGRFTDTCNFMILELYQEL